MPTSVADLKALQGKIKRDPGGYKEEFLLQQRHYRALLVRGLCCLVRIAYFSECCALRRSTQSSTQGTGLLSAVGSGLGLIILT